MYKKIIVCAVCVFIPAVFILGYQKNASDEEQIALMMDLDTKIGQMLMVGVPDTVMNASTAAIIEKYRPGGVLLFGFNLASSEKTSAYIQAMQRKSMEGAGIPLFVSIDQEGGRVKRITDGVTQFPGNMAFGIADDVALVRDAARILGIQLRMYGVNMNLAPALDVNNNPDNPVINTRSFGSSPDVVARMGVAYIKGLQDSQCMAIGKHFPGHGNTGVDSHFALPVISYGVDQLWKVDLVPFKAAIENGVCGIMSAHIMYPSLVSDSIPATVSKEILTGLLRRDLGFEGLVLTDDMEMHAVTKMMCIGDAAVKAVAAGADIVLLSSHGESVPAIVRALKSAVEKGVLTEERINASVQRILRAKLRYTILRYADGKPEMASPVYSDEELRLLLKADAINRAVSRNAVYFYGDRGFDSIAGPASSGTRLLVTANHLLAGELTVENGAAFRLVSDAGLNSAINASGGKKVVVYYHVDALSAGQAAAIRALTRRSGVTLVLLSTGNPFPIMKLQPTPIALFTFSNTPESIRQLASCLRNEFTPRQTINFSLGITR